MKRLIVILFIVLMPALFIYLIKEQFIKIRRSPDSYYKQTGIVDDFGITTSKTHTFFIKFKECDTLYSYSQSIFNRNYEAIIKNLNKGDSLLVYHEGFNKRQNTVDIVQLEKQGAVIISKTLYNNKETILLVWFCLLLALSLFPVYMFVRYGFWISR